MRIQKTKNEQYILTIPKALVEALGLGKGEEVEFRIAEKNELRLLITHGKKKQ